MSHELTKLMVAVDTFAAMMKRKLLVKAEQGEHGWDAPENLDRMREKLKVAVKKLVDGDRKQAVDCGNLSMFLAFTHDLYPDEEDGDENA